MQAMAHLMERLFLSTLSLRRATFPINVMSVSAVQISIHALLAESDQFKYVVQCRKVIFLSTLSLRRATKVPILSIK